MNDDEILMQFCRRHGACFSIRQKHVTKPSNYFQREYTSHFEIDSYCDLEIPLSRMVQLANLDERWRTEQHAIATNETVRNAYEQYRTVLNLCMYNNATIRY